MNLIISQQFLNNSNHVLQLLTRLFYYYTNYRAFAITCMFSGGSDSTITFTRKVQNFVLSFRQVLYRLFNCLVKKVIFLTWCDKIISKCVLVNLGWSRDEDSVANCRDSHQLQ